MKKFIRGLSGVAALSFLGHFATGQIVEPVLKLSDRTLTEFPFSLGSPVPANRLVTWAQGAGPSVTSRGVTLEGANRVGGPFGVSLAVVPGASSGAGNFLGVRLNDLEYAPTERDLELPCAGIPWVVGRTHATPKLNSSTAWSGKSYQGHGWFQISQPEIVPVTVAASNGSPNGDTDDMVYLVYGADRFVEYRYVTTHSSGRKVYRGVNGTVGAVVYQAGSSGNPDTYTVHDVTGIQMVFFGGNTSSNRANYQLWKLIDAADRVTYVGSTTITTAVTDGYSSDGRILKAFDAAGRRYDYTYTTISSVPRLTKVEATDVATSTVVQSVEYEYYVDNTLAFGTTGDLKRSTIVTPTSEPGESVRESTYYRYWKSGASAVDSLGVGPEHSIRLVVAAEGHRQYLAANSGTLSAFDSATDAQLEPYAAIRLGYSSGVVDTVVVAGEPAIRYSIAKQVNSSYTDNSGYDQAWAYRIDVTEPRLNGSSQNVHTIQYFDEVAQPLSVVATPGPSPTAATADVWVSILKRDAKGRVEITADPEVLDSYDPTAASDPFTLKTTSNGSVATTTRIAPSTSGYEALEGYVLGSYVANGLCGTLPCGDQVGSQTYLTGAGTKDLDGYLLVRPLVATSSVYPTAGGSPETTSFSYTFYGLTDPVKVEPLAIKQMTTTLPVVSTGQHGSGTARRSRAFFEPDARIRLIQLPGGDLTSVPNHDGGPITFTSYSSTTGLPVLTVENADTDRLFNEYGYTIPISFEARVGSAEHRATAISYDAQGRTISTATTTFKDSLGAPLPGTYELIDSGYRVLTDGTLVTITARRKDNSSTILYVSPASYLAHDHAGNSVASGKIAITTEFNSGDGTSSLTPADFIDVSTTDHPTRPILVSSTSRPLRLASLQQNIFTLNGGRSLESRTFFDIHEGPNRGPSLNYPQTTYNAKWDAGHTVFTDWVDGDQYDRTKYFYDSIGDLQAVEDETHTVEFFTYDVRGRITKVERGITDPIGLDGSSNIIKTTVAEHVYDAGGKGSGRVTKTTRPISSSSDRIVTHAFDYRGRKIASRSENESGVQVGPGVVFKHDNLGRVVASGSYSTLSLSSVPDPVSATTNRLSLQTTSFDANGRPYSSTEQSSLANDGSTPVGTTIQTDMWYDPEGRLALSSGASIRKMIYNDLGSGGCACSGASEQYTLATMSVAIPSYSDAIIIAEGDIVLAEDHVLKEPLRGNVQLTVHLDRHPQAMGDALVPAAGGHLSVTDSANRAKIFERQPDGKIKISLKHLTVSEASEKGRATVSASTYDCQGRCKCTQEVGDGGNDQSGDPKDMEYDPNAEENCGCEEGQTELCSCVPLQREGGGQMAYRMECHCYDDAGRTKCTGKSEDYTNGGVNECTTYDDAERPIRIDTTYVGCEVEEMPKPQKDLDYDRDRLKRICMRAILPGDGETDSACTDFSYPDHIQDISSGNRPSPWEGENEGFNNHNVGMMVKPDNYSSGGPVIGSGGLGASWLSYNSQGDVTWSQAPGGLRTLPDYDPLGRVTDENFEFAVAPNIDQSISRVEYLYDSTFGYSSGVRTYFGSNIVSTTSWKRNSWGWISEMGQDFDPDGAGSGNPLPPYRGRMLFGADFREFPGSTTQAWWQGPRRTDVTIPGMFNPSNPWADDGLYLSYGYGGANDPSYSTTFPGVNDLTNRLTDFNIQYPGVPEIIWAGTYAYWGESNLSRMDSGLTELSKPIYERRIVEETGGYYGIYLPEATDRNTGLDGLGRQNRDSWVTPMIYPSDPPNMGPPYDQGSAPYDRKICMGIAHPGHPGACGGCGGYANDDVCSEDGITIKDNVRPDWRESYQYCASICKEVEYGLDAGTTAFELLPTTKRLYLKERYANYTPSTSTNYSPDHLGNHRNREVKSWHPLVQQAYSKIGPIVGSAPGEDGNSYPPNRILSDFTTENRTSNIGFTPIGGSTISVTPTHDSDGRVTFDGTYHYKYNVLGQVAEVYYNGPYNAPGALRARFAYDGLGRRIMASYNEVQDPLDVNTLNDDVVEYFTYDESWRLSTIYRRNPGSSTPLLPYQRYIYNDPGMRGLGGSWHLDSPIGVQIANACGEFGDVPGAKTYGFLTNNRGDIVALQDETAYTYEATCEDDPEEWEEGKEANPLKGRIVMRYRYSPFGVPMQFLAADFNEDGFIDFFDYDDFVYLFENPPSDPDDAWMMNRLDFVRDGFIDFFDYDEFLIHFDNVPSGVAEWGEQDVAVATGARLLFAGYWWDAKLGLYHVRNRDYDPFFERWIQPDPAGYVDGYNLYRYCSSQPELFIDPLGLATGAKEVFDASANDQLLAEQCKKLNDTCRIKQLNGDCNGAQKCWKNLSAFQCGGTQASVDSAGGVDQWLQSYADSTLDAAWGFTKMVYKVFRHPISYGPHGFVYDIIAGSYQLGNRIEENLWKQWSGEYVSWSNETSDIAGQLSGPSLVTVGAGFAARATMQGATACLRCSAKPPPAQLPRTPAIQGMTVRGPFARFVEGVVATGPKVTKAQRTEVLRRANGQCHNCGGRAVGGDHIPPTAINPTGGRQLLYAHCRPCQLTQAAMMKKAAADIRAGRIQPGVQSP